MLFRSPGTRENLLQVSAQQGGFGFGGVRSFSELSGAEVTPASNGQVDLSRGVMLLQSPGSMSLGTVQSLSTVLSLVPVVSAPTAGEPAQLQGNGATSFDPSAGIAATSSGACTALVLREQGGYRCGTGAGGR